MSTPTPTTREHRLVTTVQDAHQHAHDSLDEGRMLDAVAWLSAHLAATHRVVHRAARVLPTDRVSVSGQRHIDQHLERVVRVAEQQQSGDALTTRVDPAGIERVLRRAIADHARAEHLLLTELVATVPSDAAESIADAYERALERAPTRPHPHVPHGGLLGHLGFRVDAWRDVVMNTLDSRHVPSPRVNRRVAAPSRWSAYLLGEVQPTSAAKPCG